jgi:radical SAM-linked protein
MLRRRQARPRLGSWTVTNAARRQPEQQAPPVQKLQVRYAKRGRARFTSHRDFARAFERALRRAGVPMAYSSGFNPHPRVSFANASPTGAATEAEYLEIGLARRVDVDAVARALDAALPEGLDVLEVVEAAGSLAERLTASDWRIDLPGADEATLAAAVAAVGASDSVQVERMTKAGLRSFDARAAMITLAVSGRCVAVTLAHGTPLVRPDDVVQALVRVGSGFAVADPPILTRLAQGCWREGRIVGPFEVAPGA